MSTSKPVNPIARHSERPATKLYLLWRTAWTAVVVMSMLSLSASVIGTIQVLTLGRARRFCMNVIARRFARIILGLVGLRVRVHGAPEAGALPAVFLGNHTSTLDFFVISALGLKDARAFLGTKNRIFIPVTVMGYALGNFFIPPQDYPAERAACYQRAEEALRRSGDSIFITPEGTRYLDGEIGPFNKGAFHLATNLGRPIIPIFVSIPPEINPGKGYKTRPGVVDVHFHPPIPTEGWTLDALEANKAAVRQVFVDFPGGAWARSGDI